MPVSLKLEIAGLTETQARLNRMKDDLGNKVITETVNRLAEQGETRVVRGIYTEYAIKQSDIRAKITLKRARRNGNRFTAEINANPFGTGKRALNLIHFVDKKGNVRMAKRSARLGAAFGGRVTYDLLFKIKRNESPKPIAGAFIGNDGRTVFMRIGKSRLPIKAGSTIGVPQMFNAKKIQRPVLEWIRDNAARVFDQQCARFIAKLK